MWRWLFPKKVKAAPSQAELSRKAYYNRPPPAFGQEIKHTLCKGVSRPVKKGWKHNV